MNTNLYSLPKDILVKLVSTIREDIVKEYEQKFIDYDEKIKSRLKINSHAIVCNYIGCATVINFDYDGPKCYGSESYNFCCNCNEVFCYNHQDKHYCYKCT